MKHGNGISFSLFGNKGGINTTDIEGIRRYNSLIEQGTTSQTAFYRTMQNTSMAAQQLVTSANGATVAEEVLTVETNRLTVAQRVAAVGMKALSIAGNIALFLAVTEGIQLTVKAIDNYVHRLDKAKEAFANLNSEHEATVQKISDLKQQIDDLNKSMSELQKQKSFSFTSDEQYKKLQAQGDELQRQLEIQQQLEKYQKKQAEEAAIKAVNTTTSSKYAKSDLTFEHGGGEGHSVASQVTQSQEIKNAIDAYNNYQKAIDDTESAQSKLGGKTEENAKQWNKYQKTIDDNKSKLIEAGSYISNLAKDLETQKESISGTTESGKDALSQLTTALSLFDDWTQKTKEIAQATQEANEATKDTFGINDLASAVDGFSAKLNDLKSGNEEFKTVLDAVNNGTVFTGEQIQNLIKKYPDLEKHVVQTTDGFKLEDGALQELDSSSLSLQSSYVSSQTTMTQAALDQSKSRIKAFETEMTAYKSALDVYSQAIKSGNTKLAEGYNDIYGFGNKDAMLAKAKQGAEYIQAKNKIDDLEKSINLDDANKQINNALNNIDKLGSATASSKKSSGSSPSSSSSTKAADYKNKYNDMVTDVENAIKNLQSETENLQSQYDLAVSNGDQALADSLYKQIKGNQQSILDAYSSGASELRNMLNKQILPELFKYAPELQGKEVDEWSQSVITQITESLQKNGEDTDSSNAFKSLLSTAQNIFGLVGSKSGQGTYANNYASGVKSIQSTTDSYYSDLFKKQDEEIKKQGDIVDGIEDQAKTYDSLISLLESEKTNSNGKNNMFYDQQIYDNQIKKKELYVNKDVALNNELKANQDALLKTEKELSNINPTSPDAKTSYQTLEDKIKSYTDAINENKEALLSNKQQQLDYYNDVLSKIESNLSDIYSVQKEQAQNELTKRQEEETKVLQDQLDVLEKKNQAQEDANSLLEDELDLQKIKRDNSYAYIDESTGKETTTYDREKYKEAQQTLIDEQNTRAYNAQQQELEDEQSALEDAHDEEQDEFDSYWDKLTSDYAVHLKAYKLAQKYGYDEALKGTTSYLDDLNKTVYESDSNLYDAGYELSKSLTDGMFDSLNSFLPDYIAELKETAKDRADSINQMIENSKAFASSNSAFEKGQLSDDNKSIGDSLGAYYDANTGTWYTDDTKSQKLYDELTNSVSANSVKLNKETKSIGENSTVMAQSTKETKKLNVSTNSNTTVISDGTNALRISTSDLQKSGLSLEDKLDSTVDGIAKALSDLSIPYVTGTVTSYSGGTSSGGSGFGSRVYEYHWSDGTTSKSSSDNYKTARGQAGKNSSVGLDSSTSYVEKNANGTLSAKEGLSWVNENGNEIIVHKPTSSSKLAYLQAGDGVLTANITKNLLQIGSKPSEYFQKYGAELMASSLANITPLYSGYNNSVAPNTELLKSLTQNVDNSTNINTLRVEYKGNTLEQLVKEISLKAKVMK